MIPTASGDPQENFTPSTPLLPPRGRGLARILWGDRAPAWLLPLAATTILVVMLGSQDLWTHEGRWALICREMDRSGDYFHPRLFDDDYFDKPLLSYWFMIGAGRLMGGLNEWALRLPGVLAGLATLLCTVRLGTRLGTRDTGLTAGWLLVSCFFFVFWSRLACSDMLNVAAVTMAVAWYAERRDRPGLVTWGTFFAILGFGSQLKGPIAAALAIPAVAYDLASAARWRLHLRPSFFLGLLPGALAFLLPYGLAWFLGAAQNDAAGLGAMFQENLVRYFRPFDHADPAYTYAHYLSAYALPWTPLLPFVFWRGARRWKRLDIPARLPLIASLAIFAILTLGAGRRNYYILPILPFLMLAAAEWIHSAGASSRRASLAAWTAVVSWVAMLVFFGAAAPYAAARGGERVMAAEVKAAAEAQAPWATWEVELYSVKPQPAYYLDTGRRPHRFGEDGSADLAARIRARPRTILVTRQKYLEEARRWMGPSSVVHERSKLPGSIGRERSDEDSLVALIPHLARAREVNGAADGSPGP